MLQIRRSHQPINKESPSHQMYDKWSQHHSTRETGRPIILASHLYIASHQHTNADTDNIMLRNKIQNVLKDISERYIKDKKKKESNLDVFLFSFAYIKPPFLATHEINQDHCI